MEHLKAPAPGSTGSAANESVAEVVKGIIQDVRTRGDVAVRELSARFDSWEPDSFRLSADAIEKIVSTVPKQVIDDIVTVQENVRAFAQHQLDSMQEFEVETMPGVFLGQKHVPVEA